LPIKDEHYLFDTSAALALVDRQHTAHTWLRALVKGGRRGLAGHAYFETYSVLTRLPRSAGRLSPASALALIEQDFPDSRFLTADQQSSLLAAFSKAGLAGGSVYDALVGAAARAHDLPLVSCDVRALTTYRALNIQAVVPPD
jgi:predicted nucleic acid-binding protein